MLPIILSTICRISCLLLIISLVVQIYRPEKDYAFKFTIAFLMIVVVTAITGAAIAPAMTCRPIVVMIR